MPSEAKSVCWGQAAVTSQARCGKRGDGIGDDVPVTETVKVYVSGWLEFRVDNPAALSDAARFTPNELPDPSHVLADVPGQAWDANALLVEVSKRATLNPPPVPPGTELVDRHISYTLSPPNA